MSWFYRVASGAARFSFFCTVRLKVIRPEAALRPGPYLLACTHLSHLDPVLLGCMIRREIDWLARAEFYRHRWAAWMLDELHAICIRRSGVPVSAIRRALGSLGQGRIVGICPEGGVVQGAESVLHGASIKRGVCLLSYRSGVPVLPCVVLGSDKLNRIGPWLPARRARLWVAFGSRCIQPPPNLSDRRGVRERMAQELEQEFRALCRELLEAYHLPESFVP